MAMENYYNNMKNNTAFLINSIGSNICSSYFNFYMQRRGFIEFTAFQLFHIFKIIKSK